MSADARTRAVEGEESEDEAVGSEHGVSNPFPRRRRPLARTLTHISGHMAVWIMYELVVGTFLPLEGAVLVTCPRLSVHRPCPDRCLRHH